VTGLLVWLNDQTKVQIDDGKILSQYESKNKADILDILAELPDHSSVK